MDKPNYLGYAVLEISKLHMYETYYDKIQPYFIQENIQLQYIDTVAFVLGVNTHNTIRGFKEIEDVFDFSRPDQNHELFSNKNRKAIGKFKIETPKNIFVDEFIALRSKMFSVKGGNDGKNE